MSKINWADETEKQNPQVTKPRGGIKLVKPLKTEQPPKTEQPARPPKTEQPEQPARPFDADQLAQPIQSDNDGFIEVVNRKSQKRSMRFQNKLYWNGDAIY